jgi:glucosamine-phosphate N-acetyltransferase
MNIHYIDFNLFINENIVYIEQIKNKYLELLSELTVTHVISTEHFIKNIKNISKMGLIYIGYTGLPSYDDNSFKIVASGTIIIEPKIIRHGLSCGHIEDIVVKNEFRGQGISYKILEYLKNYAFSNHCYKVILDCDDSVVKVYEKNGFVIKGHQMALYK